MQGITSRWLLKMLAWTDVKGGVFRLNRRLSYVVGDGRITFTNVGNAISVIPDELGELPFLRNFADQARLEELANAFTQRAIKPGEEIVTRGKPADSICLVAHGRVQRSSVGEYGEESVLDVLANGDHFGFDPGDAPNRTWEFTAQALTTGSVLVLDRRAFDAVVNKSDALKAHIAAYVERAHLPRDDSGEAVVEVTAGHSGEPRLPGTFVDYELSPREYELHVAQSIVRVHTRVADLFNDPMNQVEEQIRLTVETLRERQEYEMLNNHEIGLLHNADLRQRLHTRGGPPTPDDLDDLLALVWKEPSFFLAHPRTIAAFGRECNHRGLYPQTIDLAGHKVAAWRGVPIFPSSKIPISDTRLSSILLMRTGAEKQGVVGLQQTGIPDEHQPSLSVRFMGINEQAIMSYLVSAYYSAAVLVPDALAILDGCEIGHPSD